MYFRIEKLRSIINKNFIFSLAWKLCNKGICLVEVWAAQPHHFEIIRFSVKLFEPQEIRLSQFMIVDENQ